jgi:hypothetical protein
VRKLKPVDPSSREPRGEVPQVAVGVGVVEDRSASLTAIAKVLREAGALEQLGESYAEMMLGRAPGPIELEAGE